jgi:hypothetical protein
VDLIEFRMIRRRGGLSGVDKLLSVGVNFDLEQLIFPFSGGPLLPCPEF